MENFTQIKYVRYTIEQAKTAYLEVYNLLENAKTVNDCINAREKHIQIIKNFNTPNQIAEVRYSLNTRDEFYANEVDYYNQTSPMFSELMLKYTELMLNTPFRKQLEKQLNPQVYKMYVCQSKAYSPIILKEKQEENTLTTKYSTLLSQILVDYNGEKIPFSIIRGKLEDSDRQVRKDVCCAIGVALQSHQAELDGIFDQLVKVRDAMAKKMGYANFVELGYYRMQRIDYDQQMISTFRQNVYQSIVPVVTKLKEEIAGKIGIAQTMFYDDGVYLSNGNPKPILNKDQIFVQASKMYNDISQKTGEFFDEMVKNEAFDVVARDGKMGGGYCTDIADYAQPFIFANFNGSSADIEVMTHEFGHAYAYGAMFEKGDYEINIGGYETAECHSMSMEFFCGKYMQKFFGEDTKKYLYKHICAALSFIPYGVMVDEFQHIVYQQPTLTPDQRCEKWKELEHKYKPYMSCENIPYLERGARWQYQAHIYENPFYYIDYCLAQTVAFGFLVAMQSNYKKAFDKYIELVYAGGNKGFDKLIKDSGVAYPFANGTLDNVANEVLKILSKLS
ncbi:MAG: M3 family oligoendopeptidase [Clostridia bacterium]